MQLFVNSKLVQTEFQPLPVSYQFKNAGNHATGGTLVAYIKPTTYQNRIFTANPPCKFDWDMCLNLSKAYYAPSRNKTPAKETVSSGICNWAASASSM